MQKRDLYLNQFSNKKGPFVNLRGKKCAPSGAAHSCTHLSTMIPPPKLMMYSCNHENDVTYIIGRPRCIISLSNYKVIQKTIHVTIHKSSPWRLVQRSRITKAEKQHRCYSKSLVDNVTRWAPSALGQTLATFNQLKRDKKVW